MEWVAEGRQMMVTVFSDVAEREGIGWELADVAPAPGRGDVLEVFRDDSGPQPVLSSRILGPAPAVLVSQFAYAAVSDLLPLGRHSGGERWLARAVAEALALVGTHIVGWEAVEEAVHEPADDQLACVFAEPDSPRVPYTWLRAEHRDGQTSTVYNYQDDWAFGLRFVKMDSHRLDTAAGIPSRRVHADLDLPLGRVDSVRVTVDFSVVDEWQDDGLLSEAVLVVDGQPFMLIAADAYGPDEWHRYGDAVSVLRDPLDADRLEWI